MSTVRQIVLSLLLLGGAAGGYYFYDHLTAESAISGDGRGGGRTISVEVAPVVREVVRDRAEAVGTTLANQAIEIVSLASGRIIELLFEPGQPVEAGAVLARLDDAIEQADLVEARAMLKEAESALDRARRLRASNNVAEATVVELEAAAAAAQARVDRAAQRLEDRLVRAPFDGVVGIRRVDLGARVDNDTVITTLDDRSEMIVEFMLPEVFYGRIQPGLKVQASSTSFPDRSFAGTLTSIDTRVDVNSRAFRVRASLPNPDLVLPAGLFVLVDITLGERDAVIVPEEAVVSEADRSFVYVAGPERAERRPVDLGTRSVGVIEIRDGLEEGELVITRGLQRLRDGVAISYELPETIEPDHIALPSGDIG